MSSACSYSLVFLSNLFHELVTPSLVHLSHDEKDSATHDNVINRDMDQFHKEANKFHDSKSYCCGHGSLLEFFSMNFGAPFN